MESGTGFSLISLSAVLSSPVACAAFENIHDGRFGWRTSWIGRVCLPRDRGNSNRGEGTLLNWIGQANSALSATSLQYDVSSPVGLVSDPDLTATGTGSTGVSHVYNHSAVQVVADICMMIDQLRVSNPNVRIAPCWGWDHRNTCGHPRSPILPDLRISNPAHFPSRWPHLAARCGGLIDQW